MPRNVEIKARVDDWSATLTAVARIGAIGPTPLSQHDTFFECAAGRLKLRAFSPTDGELIFYRRADSTGPSTSFYCRTPTADPGGLGEALTLAYGAAGHVVKHRLLFLRGRTRIHLDQVDGLGDFIELEVVLGDDEAVEDGEAEARHLLAALGIADDRLVATAYVDLLRQAAGR